MLKMLKEAVLSKSLTKFDGAMLAAGTIAVTLCFWLLFYGVLDSALMARTLESYSKLKADGLIAEPVYKSLTLNYVDEWSTKNKWFGYGLYAVVLIQTLFVAVLTFRAIYVFLQDILKWLRRQNPPAGARG